MACRALASSGDPGLTGLDALLGEPTRVATVALRPAVDGTARLVPFGPVARTVVGMDGDDLVVVDAEGDGSGTANLGSSSLGDRSLRGPGRTVLASGEMARSAHGRRPRRVAHAHERCAGRSGGGGTGHRGPVRQGPGAVRHPIGSFQSIARDLADAATLVDGARLLAREAAWAQMDDEEQFASLASMAFQFATRAARRASNVALHVHGGYGFTLEYDIQLYYRRAEAWPLRLGDPRRGAADLADALFGPWRAI